MEIISFVNLLYSHAYWKEEEDRLLYYNKVCNYRKTYENTLSYFIECICEYFGDFVFDWDSISPSDSTVKLTTELERTSDDKLNPPGELYPPVNNPPAELNPPDSNSDSSSDVFNNNPSQSKSNKRGSYFFKRNPKDVS